MNAREIKLYRQAQNFRGPADEAKIRAQIAEAGHRAPPPKRLELDGTKIALHQERLEAWRRGEAVAPITIDMALTQKCSYSCTFCYAGLQQNPQSPVEWPVYETFLEDCAELGVKAISLVSDGESTENPDHVRFIRKAKDLGIDIALGTNGLKLTSLETLAECLTYLRINFNAADPQRYAKIMGASVTSYERVVQKIETLAKMKGGMTLGLQMVLLPEYADEVIPLARLGQELGVDYLVIKHCSDDENGRLGVPYAWYRSDLANALFDAAESLSTETYSVQVKRAKMQTGNQRAYSKCLGPPLFLQMSGSGIVAPCGSFFSERYKRYHIGDIKQKRFKDIVRSFEYRKVMAYLGSGIFDPRKQCASLCVQDRANLALFNWVEHHTPLPQAIDNTHRNFV